MYSSFPSPQTSQTVDLNSTYLNMLFRLMSMAGLLLVPQIIMSEHNWRFVSILLLFVGWILVFDFVRWLRQKSQKNFDGNLLLVYSILVFCFFLFLGVGTIRFLRWPELEQISGRCNLKALTHKRGTRYVLVLTAKNNRSEYELKKPQFQNLIKQGQEFKASKEFTYYECFKEEVTITKTPHFGFFVKAE